MTKLIRIKKEVKKSEVKKSETISENNPEPNTFFEEPLSKDETLVTPSIEDLGKWLKNLDVQIMCNHENCEETDCTHYKFHDKLKTCGEVCGIHSEAKCI